jgi:hypothetical protein
MVKLIEAARALSRSCQTNFSDDVTDDETKATYSYTAKHELDNILNEAEQSILTKHYYKEQIGV